MIDKLVGDGYAVLVVCDVLDYPRSTYYRTAKPVTDDALRGHSRNGGAVATLRLSAGDRPTAPPRLAGEPQAHPTLDAVDDLPQKIKAKKRRTTNSAHDFPRYSSLGYLTPVEFEAQWRASQAGTSVIP